MSKVWKSIKEYECYVEGYDFDEYMFDGNDIIIHIGGLSYNNYVLDCIHAYNYNGKIKTLDREIVENMELCYNDPEDYHHYGSDILVKDIENVELREFLITSVLDAYAEYLCK